MASSCRVPTISNAIARPRIISLVMAMMTKRRIEVVAFERERIVRRVVPIYCTVCQLNTELLTTRQAGMFVQVKPQSIYRWLAQGKAHGVKTPGGQYRICKYSLFHQVHFSLPHGDNSFAHEGDPS